MNDAKEVLKRIWGFNSFKGPQQEIIESVLDKKDVFALLPTGGGKSLCYQLPTMMQDGLCLVISPLIALMEDQIQHLDNIGIKAVVLSSKLNKDDMITAFDNLSYGPYKFLYISPEKLQSTFVQEKIAGLNINLIAVDEAHCISQWGHDFRPSYLNIRKLTESISQVPIIALTATASPKVQKDIIENLDLNDVSVFKETFFRSNLSIHVIEKENFYSGLKPKLNLSNDPAIVYTGTRKESMHLSEYLNRYGINSNYYHGGMAYDQKSASLKSWTAEAFQVMVATNAFGMGIDKSNVRTIIHVNIPFSLENYMQEIGRAGRDGKPSDIYLFYNEQTIFEAREFLNKTQVTAKDCQLIYSRLNEYFQIAKGELQEQPFLFDLSDFASVYSLNPLKVFTVLNQFEQEDIIFFDQNLNRSSNIRIIDNQKRLLSFQNQKSQRALVVQLLLRTYGGIQEQFINVNESSLAKKLNLSKGQIVQILQHLHDDKVLHYNKSAKKLTIRFLVPREERYVMARISKNIESRNRVKRKNLEAVIKFVKDSDLCRYQHLLYHFGESCSPCGQCDICSSKNMRQNPGPQPISENLIQVLEDQGPLGIDEICEILQVERKPLVKTLEILKEERRIKVNLQNKIILS